MTNYIVTYTVTVDAEDEAQAYTLADAGKGGGEWIATPVEAPRLILITHEGEGEDGPWYEVQCPHCSVLSREIVEVDKAVRYNVADLEMDDDLEQFGLAYGTGQEDFEHDTYVCGTCDEPVNLPEGFDDPDESWS